MITYVTLPEATANIVQLLDRVAQGEEIIISQAGKTIAHISPPPKILEPRIHRMRALLDTHNPQSLKGRSLYQWSGHFFIVNDRMRVSGSPEDQILTVECGFQALS